jgi:hypothetical protein
MPIDYAVFRRIPRDALRMLRIDDYYEGPLSGMLIYGGKLRWFECVNFAPETNDIGARHYIVRDLTDEQMVEEQKRHALFVEHVGDHWTVHDDGREAGGTAREVLRALLPARDP